MRAGAARLRARPPPGEPEAAARRGRSTSPRSAGLRTERTASWLAACAAAALVISFGTLHRQHTGDSLVPVLASLQRWTPFYWEQARLGWLVPLLALPFRGGVANLLAQTVLNVSAALAAVFLLARYALGGRGHVAAGGLAAASLLALAPERWRFLYLTDQPYGVSLFLGLAALWALERRRPARAALALALVCAAHWVNLGAGIVLLPLVVARHALASFGEDRLRMDPLTLSVALACEREVEGSLRERTRVRGDTLAGAVARALLPDLALILLGLAAGQVLFRLAPFREYMSAGLTPPASWPAAWRALATGGVAAAGRWGVVLLAAWTLALALAVHPRTRGAVALRPALVLAATALSSFLATGMLSWVAASGFAYRYLIPGWLLLHAGAAVALAGALRPAPRIGAVAAGAVLAAAFAVYGLPSVAGVRRQLEALAGAEARAAVAARCRVVAGSYWTVWPTVFWANTLLREAGEHRTVFGLTHRAQPTFDLWRTDPAAALRVCVVDSAAERAEAGRYFEGYGLPPLEIADRAPGVIVLRPVATPPVHPGR